MTSPRPQRLRGVLAPVVTPFRDTLAPNVDTFVAHCRWLVGNGCGLAIFGTNSEANSLSVGERIALTDALLEAGVPASAMMPGTGASALPDTVQLTRHAVQAGAAGALMLPPFFYKNVSDEGLFAYYSEVIERVGDARLALYLYHIPALSGVPITLNLIERLFKRYPGALAGVKDSSGDWSNTQAMIDAFGRDGLDIFPASEALLSRALPIGGAGCISATANVNPANIAQLCERWNTPDGPALQDKASTVRSLFQALPMIPAMKHALAHWHDDAAWRTVRPPLTALDDAAGRQLIAQLQAARFDMPGLRDARHA
ncbi:dihydrodipicolinate synthase family protein [Burkholderia sp. Ac-20379]|uniref:dihydrodipicolinate synthase family protein n=1 Tax=Burkholderia sp. Ac-20379 TaxID=2703900 RepID=UPI00197ED887|nr:dihydrodipicolinate synthase family protein [Burkholderia sp. Ac-20379]MBN3725116.1 dihydrodipicolinate synthase family protein [Burkholderia sp. Ac-20379]